jgi:hypothetical protein
VKTDGRLHIGQGLLIGIAFANDDAPQAERIGDIPPRFFAVIIA